MPVSEHVPDQSIVLAQIQLAIITGHDPCSILPPVLQHRQSVVETDSYFITGYYSNQSAHNMLRDASIFLKPTPGRLLSQIDAIHVFNKNA